MDAPALIAIVAWRPLSDLLDPSRQLSMPALRGRSSPPNDL